MRLLLPLSIIRLGYIDCLQYEAKIEGCLMVITKTPVKELELQVFGVLR